MHLILERSYMPDNSCTLGKLTLPDGWSCYIMENPWQDNARNVSCIPEGTYTLGKRQSPMVERTSRGAFSIGWEVQGVPGRDFIMIHPGNYVRNTDGCLLPGLDISFTQDEGLMVTSSQIAFKELMERLKQQESWQIIIKTKEGGK